MPLSLSAAIRDQPLKDLSPRGSPFCLVIGINSAVPLIAAYPEPLISLARVMAPSFSVLVTLTGIGTVREVVETSSLKPKLSV